MYMYIICVGVVPAHSSLVCAIFCQGNVPKECTRLTLTLNVEGGEKKKLHCSLKVHNYHVLLLLCTCTCVLVVLEI